MNTDETLYEKIIRRSKLCYNVGLQKAKVRDLSGAALALRQSLKYDKMNTPARNLLGLVYFEMGETVEAFSQWVISRSLNPQDALAKEYLTQLQSNKNKLEGLNQTIKKYNQALAYCRAGSTDLAVLQLKKVLSLNNNLLRGHQLLALIYLKEGKKDLAAKSLRQAAKIDAGNTLTLRYQMEIGEEDSKDEKRKEKEAAKKDKLLSYQSGNDTIIRPAYFRDGSTVSTLINIGIGLLIGVAVTWFLLVQGAVQTAKSDSNQSMKELNESLNTKTQLAESRQKQIDDLKEQITKMEEEGSANEEVAAANEALLVACETYLGGDEKASGEKLATVDTGKLTEQMMALYNAVSAKVNAKFLDAQYTEGSNAYNKRDYDTAIEKLTQVVSVEEDYHGGDAVYFLAQAYRKNNEPEKALEWYKKVLEHCPAGSVRAKNATGFINSLQQQLGNPPGDGGAGTDTPEPTG